jgi:hypothetical protein
MSAFSKSLFTNSQVFSSTRSLINPISLSIGQGGTGQVDIINSDVLDFLNDSYLAILRKIELDYGRNMANKTYEYIPSVYDDYALLLTQLKLIQSRTTNTTMRLFLKLAEDTLIGSVNSFTLYGDNLLLQIDKANLEKRIDDILRDKNVGLVENTFSYNNMSITKTFKLATVFNYYIMIYGLPAAGVGFDPVKISFLVTILREKGIDPYG